MSQMIVRRSFDENRHRPALVTGLSRDAFQRQLVHFRLRAQFLAGDFDRDQPAVMMFAKRRHGRRPLLAWNLISLHGSPPLRATSQFIVPLRSQSISRGVAFAGGGNERSSSARSLAVSDR